MTNVPCHTAKCYSLLVEEKTTYTFTIGRKGHTRKITIEFTNDEFKHLAGLQYLKDIKFPSPKAEDALIFTRDSPSFQQLILSSVSFSQISERITHLEHLDWVLRQPDDIVVWEQKKSRFGSKLSADYIISRLHNQKCDIFGIKQKGINYRGVTFIVNTHERYISGQTKWTVLKIERSDKNTSEMVFVSPRFKEDETTTDNI